MADNSDFSKGDHVTWNSIRGPVHGHVVEEVTHDVKIKSHTVKASEDDPKIIVESDKTGARAGHKASALEPDE